MSLPSSQNLRHEETNIFLCDIHLFGNNLKTCPFLDEAFWWCRWFLKHVTDYLHCTVHHFLDSEPGWEWAWLPCSHEGALPPQLEGGRWLSGKEAALAEQCWWPGRQGRRWKLRYLQKSSSNRTPYIAAGVRADILRVAEVVSAVLWL